MKTQITKQNALVIIETAVKQETMLSTLETLLDSCGGNLNGSITVLEALFNIDFSDMPQEDYDKYWNIYFNEIKSSGSDYAKKAESIYTKTLKFTLKREKQSEKQSSPGVISLLSGQNYNIKGEFNLTT